MEGGDSACFRFGKIYINLLSLVICFIIFFSISFISKCIFNFLSHDIDTNFFSEIEDKESDENTDLAVVSNSEENTQVKFDWSLEIPKINLYAEIAEGTEMDTLNKYIGHFSESPKDTRKCMFSST